MTLPTIEKIRDAQNVINRQFPALVKIQTPTVLVALSAEHLATIATALGVCESVVHEGLKPTPVQVAWAAIIESALLARGGPPLMPEMHAALHHVEASTLERMACLVLAHASAPTVRATTSLETGKLTIEIGTPGDAPDTPETVAAKCIAARAAGDAFRAFSPDVEPKGGVPRG